MRRLSVTCRHCGVVLRAWRRRKMQVEILHHVLTCEHSVPFLENWTDRAAELLRWVSR